MKNTVNIEFFKKYAIDRGGKCLTKTYFNLKIDLIFICKKNNVNLLRINYDEDINNILNKSIL